MALADAGALRNVPCCASMEDTHSVVRNIRSAEEESSRRVRLDKVVLPEKTFYKEEWNLALLEPAFKVTNSGSRFSTGGNLPSTGTRPRALPP